MKLRSHLIILVVAALLPVLIFAGVMIHTFSKQQYAAVDRGLLDTTRALALAVDRDLEASIESLRTLATSGYLDSRDLKQFYDQAVRMLKSYRRWQTIVLFEPSGQQIMNTRRPFDSPLPPIGTTDVIKQVVQTAKPVVSNLFPGQLARGPIISVDVPVIREGKTRYVLAASASPEFLTSLLARQKISSDWLATILDRNKIIIARSRDLEYFLGRPAGPRFAAKSEEAKEITWRGVTLDGVSVYAAASRSELSGWTVGLATPASAVEAPMRRSLWITAAGGLTLLLAGIIVAALFGRRISNSISSLSNAAAALGRSETPQTTTSPIIEVNNVARVIKDAAVKLKRAEEELRILTHQRAVVLHLSSLALKHSDLETLFNEVVKLTAETLGVDYCKILELLPDGSALLLRSGVGWKEGLVGDATVGIGTDSQAGYTLLAKEPVIVEDLRTEARFRGPALLLEHGVISGMSIVIQGKEKPFGILGAHTTRQQTFNETQVHFLESVANLLATAIERNRAEEELRKTSQTLSALVSASPHAINLLDLDGKVRMWNLAAEQIFGWTAAEVLGRPLPIAPDSKLAEFRELHAKVLRGERLSGAQICSQRKDGLWIDVSLSAAPIQDAHGHVVGSMAILADISERKRLKKEVAEISEKERQRLGQDLHDSLGQHLTGTAFIAKSLEESLAQKSLPQAADAREITALVNQAIEQTRAISRGLYPVGLEMSGLVSALEALVSNAATLFNIPCQFQCDDSVPPKDSSASIHLYRIAQQALDNAIKHSKARRILVSLFSDNGNIILSVRDDGIGLPEVLDKNAGMGLYTMKHRAGLIRASLTIARGERGGTVVVCSVPGSGASES